MKLKVFFYVIFKLIELLSKMNLKKRKRQIFLCLTLVTLSKSRLLIINFVSILLQIRFFVLQAANFNSTLFFDSFDNLSNLCYKCIFLLLNNID